MPRISTIALLLAAVSPVAATTALAFVATDQELDQRIRGSWGQDEACSTGTMAFSSDGTFAFTGPRGTETGTWRIVDGILTAVGDNGKPDLAVEVSFVGDQLKIVEAANPQGFLLFRCAA